MTAWSRRADRACPGGRSQINDIVVSPSDRSILAEAYVLAA
jgi:hypothetical protein